MCNIDHLTNDLLGKVLSFCSDAYPDLQQVCKKWNQVANNYIGRVLVIKSGPNFSLDTDTRLEKLAINANYWMTLSADENISPDPNSHPELAGGDAATVSQKPLQIPKNVRKIGFIGAIPHHLLNDASNKYTYLTGLYLHLSVFASKLSKDFSSNVSSLSPNVTNLVIDCGGMTSEIPSITFNYPEVFLSVVHFLDANFFTRLQKVIFGVPYVESMEGLVVRSLSHFFSKHCETLKSFSIHQKYTVQEEAKEESSSDEDESADATPNSYSKYLSLKELGDYAMLLKKVSVEDMYIWLHEKQESSPLWQNMILHQEQLRQLVYVGDKMFFPESSLACNAPTLTSLVLDTRDTVDLTCFRKCIHLKRLTLKGKFPVEWDDEDVEVEDDQDGVAQLKNAQCLPSNLELVEIINLTVENLDAKQICLGLPHLKDLKLVNLGREGTFGVGLEDLSGIWSGGRLDHFCVKASLNMGLYWEAEETGSVKPELNLMACLIKSMSFGSGSRFHLEVWKDESGRYSLSRPSWKREGEEDVFELPVHVELTESEDESEDESEEEESSDEEEEKSEDEDGWEDAQDSIHSEESDGEHDKENDDK